MVRAAVAALSLALATVAPVHAQGGGAAAGTAPPASARAAAPVDLVGTWVSLVTEDWRYRMVTPAKGDYQSVPMTQDALRIADAWDPEQDEAAGLQCKAFGAGGIMRVPGRLRIDWQDDDTLRLEFDAGSQTRAFRFGPPRGRPGRRSWQGESSATWLPARAARGPGSGPVPGAGMGTLKVVTTNVRAGYLRRNGVPYSDEAVITDYFAQARLASGADVLVVTTVVTDPRYLTQPFIVSTHFRRQADDTGWNPTPCASTW